jgi:hypothetical protein
MGHIMALNKTTFEGYSYRTSSRFGSRVHVLLDEETVTVTGPRLAVPVYRLWIAAQVVLFWMIVPALLAAVIFSEWRFTILALGLAIAHWAVSSFGAGCLWELVNLTAFVEGRMGQTALFSAHTVKRVMIGPEWARNGLWLVIPPYVPLVNQAAKDYCVSFEAPDGETGEDAVYAFHMQTQEDAQVLARALQAGTPAHTAA